MVNRVRGEAILPDDLVGYADTLVHAPPLRRMSVDEYHRLIDIGFFHPEERLAFPDLVIDLSQVF